jgi:hypothetical protein
MIRHRALSLAVVMALALPSPIRPVSVAVAEAEEPQPQDTSMPEGPQGVPGASDDWWSAVQNDIRQSEYYVSWLEDTSPAEADTMALMDTPPGGAYQAPNRAHNLRTYFEPEGIRVTPRQLEGETPPWEWGLTLTGYGYIDNVQPAGSATQQVDSNRVQYDRGSLTEWYVNDERGLEQGFTLHSPPHPASPSPRSALVLDLDLSGDLTPNVNGDGTAVEFTTPGGVQVLRYGNVVVTDASGRTLAAQLRLVTDPAPRDTQQAIRIVIDDASAAYPITIDPLATTPNWTAESDQDDAYFGYSVGTAGDVNDDGYADVIVGAHSYDNGNTDEGRAYVYHGSATGLSTTADWTAEGDQDEAYFGYSVGTAGDVNDDGYSDVIVGAYGYDNGETNEGWAFVYHGSETGLSTTADWTAESDQYGACLGYSVGTAGDVNDDGYSDVIVGALYYSSTKTNEGRAFVYHGSATGLSTTADWTAESGQDYAKYGYSVGTAGDVNDDGYSDVIVGAPDYDHGTTDGGRAYVYHGSATGLSTAADWTEESGQDYAEFGHSVGTAGDVNGDGYSDVIVGEYSYDGGDANEGRAYVYHGSATGLSATADWTAEGNQGGAFFGFSAGTAGEVNDDGYSDVIVGAPSIYGGEGRAYLYHGSGTGLSTTPAWTADGDQQDAYFATAVGTAGDVNGDGYDDVIVGADWYDSTETNEGRAFVYYGSPDGSSSWAHWSGEGDQASAHFGYAVRSAGDVNGDGYSDVIVSAPYYDNGETDEGRAYVYHGSATGLSTTADWSAEGDQESARFGASVGTAGDVDKDGYSDVIVSAPPYDNGETNEGRVFVYHGSATGLSTTADWTAEGNQDHAWFGISVATAGDVNGDGYSDVVVGAYYYDNGETNEGRAYVYHGSESGLSATPDWSAESNQAGACFGVSVGTAADVNGDGYSDVVVGACHYHNGEMYEGRAYVYHGSETGLSPAADWTAESDQDFAYLGYSVGTAGDVNGDGYSDVIVGAPDYDHGETDEGRAYVYHGSATGLSSTADWTAESDQDYAHFGDPVATAGDVNGDGYSDVTVGAQYYDNGETDEGHAFLYHGSATGLSTTADWTAESDQDSAHLGYAVETAGDVNGDGYSDIIVGAHYYDNGETDEGGAFVHHGSASGLSTTADWSTESDQDQAGLGDSVATAGDVNGDGFGDVIVGAPYYDSGETHEGRAFIYHGSATGLSTTADWTAEGDQAEAYFGYSVGTAGDVNGDGYSDVIVGAPQYENDETDEGRAYVYHGSATGLSTTPDWAAESDQDYAWFGHSVWTAGDVNGDGYSDIIVGAPHYDNGDTDEGQAYVYHGSATGLSATADWTAESDQGGARLGYSVGTAGDANGDGYSDVVVGAYRYDNDVFEAIDAGRAYFYLGSATGLSTMADWTWKTYQPGAYFGYSVGTAGDVNGDGFSDVIVGAPFYDNGSWDEGRAFVYHGSATGFSQWPDWTIGGSQLGEYFGDSLSTAGDVNGDGYSDVIVGVPWRDNGEPREGSAYLYQGSATGLSTTADWIGESDHDYACFGSSVSTAGDVNGDGYSDVIVGAPQYSNGQTNEGQAYVYYGNGGDGLHLLPCQLRSHGSAPIAILGTSDSWFAFRLSLIGRMPLGREEVRMQWQAAPLGTPITATTVISGSTSWTDVLTTGVEITQTVSSLVPETPYHWRVRLLYRPGNTLGQPAGRWLSIPWNGWNEADLRTEPVFHVYLPLVLRSY